MKISLAWLADFVDLDGVEPERVAELLSLHTAEVEGVEVFGSTITDVVVGEVVECSRHPDAEKLSVTQVDFGGGEAVQVVCGAPNVRQGLKVAFAPVGSVLPGGHKLKKAKLRGQVSHGMICSARELELGEDHAGILELEDASVIGRRLVDQLGLLDSVLELDNKSVTHRPDLWGHYGFARELAAILDRPLRPLPLREDWGGAPSDIPIRLEDPDGCPLYLGLEVQLGGRPATSPSWLRQRLLAVGQRPLNDVVDLTNYVLLELGQPTHAFDLARLQGPEIVVRVAAEGERFTTLDDVERSLATADLVIADRDRAVALAGVMGGAETEVSDSTEAILLESAVFHPTRIRRTSQRLALRTEASARFEKSLDPALAEQALRRFARLLEDVRPDAQLAGGPAAAGQAAAPVVRVPLRVERTAALLGLDVDRQEMVRSLTALGFGVEDGGAELQVEVPSWRATKDVTTEVDLIEEVGRLAGYHRVVPVPLRAPVQVPWNDPVRLVTRRLADRLSGAHQAWETQGYSFLHDAWARRLHQPEAAFVQVDNPVQDGVRLIRRDPVPSLLEQAAGNVRERPAGMLFELAKGYEPRSAGAPEERKWLGVILWDTSAVSPDGPASLFGHARSVTEDLLRTLQCEGSAETGLDRTLAPWAHPARGLTWKDGDSLLGFSAAVDPRLAEEVDLHGEAAAVVLLDLDVLSASAGQRRFRPPARFPAIKVDVALALPESVAYAEVEDALRKAGGKLLESLTLFDVFRGGSLAAGQRSLAFHAVLRGADRTLADKDEQKFLSKVEKAAEQLGGHLRR